MKNVKIINYGQNRKEYRVQIETETKLVFLRIPKTHPVNMTGTEFQTWILQQISNELAKQTPSFSASGVFQGLVNQTVALPPPTK